MNTTFNDSYSAFKVHHYDTLESTNLKARELAEIYKNNKQECVVVADSQSAGRGKIGRTWYSEKGNLFASYVIYPDDRIEECLKFTFLASVAVARVIKKYVYNDVMVNCKWPNDVLINSKKVSGILLETGLYLDKVEYLIVGIGININSAPDNVMYPTSYILKHSLPEFLNTQKVLEDLSLNFRELYYMFQDNNVSSIFKEWKCLCCDFGKKIKVTQNDKNIEGIFKDVDENGAIVLQVDDRLMPIFSGDIFLK